jgi:phosphoribosylamine--glycine ligase
VLGVTARGDDLTAARAGAYRAIERIHFAGMHFRRDIGTRGMT